MTAQQDWDTIYVWRQQIERRLAETATSVKGMRDYQSNRIVELVEEIEQLRKELKKTQERVKERQDAMAKWLKEHFPEHFETNGGS